MQRRYFMTKLILILIDQLSLDISSLTRFAIDSNDRVLLYENHQDFTEVKHHKKKIAFQISCMRHFKELLQQKKIKVIHHAINTKDNKASYINKIKKIVEQKKISEIVITKPSSYNKLQEIKKIKNFCKIEILADDRFLMSDDDFSSWADGKKELRMEFLYRLARKKHNILIKDNKPIGGKWNYDSSNRSPISDDKLKIPKQKIIKLDEISQECCQLVEKNYGSHFGDIDPFYFATTRKDALKILDDFIKNRLPLFGKYQDAMLENEPWLFHSHISFYLNNGLLSPMECIKKAEAAYYDKKAPIESTEGFIRQILGWREYIRGIYWYKMPKYEKENFLDATKKLPDFYWSGNTSMNCIKQCVTETKENAYAHHIQRLMILGNFALIAQIKPSAVNEWYHIVYADAYQWVELPNVTGMILFADGGVVASKPYAASGNYINKMSNYCKNCQYSPTKKEGESACPFNYLFWNFLLENQKNLGKNQRLTFMYSTLKKMSPEKIKKIKGDSKKFLDSIQ